MEYKLDKVEYTELEKSFNIPLCTNLHLLQIHVT